MEVNGKFFDAEIRDKPVYEDEQVKKPASSPFDYFNALTSTKEDIMTDDQEERRYPAFMVNRIFSMGKGTVLFANEINMRWNADARLQYDFYLKAIRKGKQFNKWLKPEKVDDLDCVVEYYGLSKNKALEALRILSVDQTSMIKESLNKGGLKKKTK